MKQPFFVLLVIALGSCAHLPARTAPETRARAELWHEAHLALYSENFARADSIFARLAMEHPDSEEGREARFYLGSIHLDPRNQAWNPERAETALRRYLQQDTLGTLIHRRPEATTLLELARQLNLPPVDRVPGLQPGAPTPSPPPTDTPRQVAPQAQLNQLQVENEQLRRELAQRDEQIARQREELERIRRALTPRNPSD